MIRQHKQSVNSRKKYKNFRKAAAFLKYRLVKKVLRGLFDNPVFLRCFAPQKMWSLKRVDKVRRTLSARRGVSLLPPFSLPVIERPQGGSWRSQRLSPTVGREKNPKTLWHPEPRSGEGSRGLNVKHSHTGSFAATQDDSWFLCGGLPLSRLRRQLP